MRLKKVVPDISRPKKSRHFLMHRMSLKLLDNFQICEHSWPCLFHIKLLLSESDVSCLLRVRSVPFTSRAKGCIKFVLHSCLVSLSHTVGVFLEDAICYFIYAKFAVMLRLSINWKSIKKRVLVQYTRKCINFTHVSHKPIKLCVI